MSSPPVDSAASRKQASDLTLFGIALAKEGKFDQAIESIRNAITLLPEYAKAHQNLGVVLAQKGSLLEASRSFEEALRLQPDYPEANYNLGNALGLLHRIDESILAYRRALRDKPDYAESMNNLGLALATHGRPEEGEILLRQALRLRPQFPEARNNLGLALIEQGQVEAAIQCFKEALDQEPRNAECHNNLGNTYKDAGRLQAAMACYDMAISLHPRSLSAHWNRSLILLQTGDYERGWKEYEWRRQKQENGIRPFTEPSWKGEPIDGKTLLIHMEQGLGDMLQFIRYASSVNILGGKVLVSCPASLVELFSSVPGVDRALDEKQELPAFDIQIPLLSLPAVFKTSMRSIPRQIPYLFPKGDRVVEWQQRLAELSGPKIGLVWQGNPSHRRDRWRSIPLCQFRAVSENLNIPFINLQLGQGLNQYRSLIEVSWVRDVGLSQLEKPSWLETAALVQNLDLIITVDTAMAHLAGGLGKPVWVLIPNSCDWRWLLERDDSPWYPSMRLFRQKEWTDWEPTLGKLERSLQNWLQRYQLDHKVGQ